MQDAQDVVQVEHPNLSLHYCADRNNRISVPVEKYVTREEHAGPDTLSLPPTNVFLFMRVEDTAVVSTMVPVEPVHPLFGQKIARWWIEIPDRLL